MAQSKSMPTPIFYLLRRLRGNSPDQWEKVLHMQRLLPLVENVRRWVKIENVSLQRIGEP